MRPFSHIFGSREEILEMMMSRSLSSNQSEKASVRGQGCWLSLTPLALRLYDVFVADRLAQLSLLKSNCL